MKQLLIGPFREIVTMDSLPLKGALKDDQLQIIKEGGILLDAGRIAAVGSFEELASSSSPVIVNGSGGVVMPGFIDMHTHIAFGGSRANDFALRNAGSSYLEIARGGGGIKSTVKATRALTQTDLAMITAARANDLLKQGITTIEVKSGYGLSLAQELKSLRAIKEAGLHTKADLVATCLAAHTLPQDFGGTKQEYLMQMATELFPALKSEMLTNRIDAFIEETAFNKEEIQAYFEKAIGEGFDLTVHADQFTPGGSEVAVRFNALSADHLEASSETEIELLANSNVVATVLPGASMGLGCAFAPARKLLNAGCSLAIATDWNPGSAPMGNLITQASVLACYEKLTNAEVFAGITFRAAAALKLYDRGILKENMIADFVEYDASSYKEILYQQGQLQPNAIWKRGEQILKPH